MEWKIHELVNQFIEKNYTYKYNVTFCLSSQNVWLQIQPRTDSWLVVLIGAL